MIGTVNRNLRNLAMIVGATLCMLSPGFSQDRNLAVDTPAPASKERRLALVIGNGAYKFAPLRNPVNDARAVAKALRSVGFEVSLRENLSRISMELAVREFGNQLRTGGGDGVFYFAGHGMQIRGRNFLLPVDANIESEEEVPYFSVDANLVLDKMEAARNPVNIMILDACRNNPFARASRAPVHGLAPMDAPTGVLIAFATAPGSVSFDGEGNNGVYTKHLVRELVAPGTAVEQMFKRVRVAVAQETNDRQTPWEASSLKGDFYFNPVRRLVPAAVAAPSDAAVELAFWESIRNSSNRADYVAYLEQFPKGRFASLARIRAGQSSPVAAAPVASAPAATSAPAEVGVSPARPPIAVPAERGALMVLAPDYSAALSVLPNHALAITDIASGRELRRLAGHTAAPVDAAFGAGGRTVVSTSLDRSLIVWDFATGRVLERVPEGGYGALALSPDSRHGVFALSGSGAQLRDMLGGRMLKTIGAGEARMERLAYAPNGRHFVAAHVDHTLRLWDIATALEVRRFDIDSAATTWLGFSRDGRYLAAGGGDGKLRLWDIGSGRLMSRLGVAGDGAVVATFSPDGRGIGAASGRAVRIWNTANGSEITRHQNVEPVAALAFNPDGKSVVIADVRQGFFNLPLP